MSLARSLLVERPKLFARNLRILLDDRAADGQHMVGYERFPTTQPFGQA